MKKPIKNKNSNNVQNGPDKEGKHVNHWSKKSFIHAILQHLNDQNVI